MHGQGFKPMSLHDKKVALPRKTKRISTATTAWLMKRVHELHKLTRMNKVNL